MAVGHSRLLACIPGQMRALAATRAAPIAAMRSPWQRGAAGGPHRRRRRRPSLLVHAGDGGGAVDAPAEHLEAVEDEEEEDVAMPLEKMDVAQTSAAVDLQTLLQRIDDSMINLEPRYQRGYIWPEKKAARLVESVMAGLFVPAIVTHSKDDGEGGEVEDVVDGKQRLTTLHAFKKGVFPDGKDGKEFRLQGLTLLPELNDKTYADLSVKGSLSRATFNRRTLTCTKFLKSTSEEAVLRVYEDLNCGAENLNVQQIRRAVFGGPYIDLLQELAGHEKLLQIRGESQLARDESDQELVLRFFALRRATNTTAGFRGLLRTCLDKEISQRRQLRESGDQADDLRSLFTGTLELAWHIYGRDAFRRWSGKSYEKKINAGLFDAVMLSLAELVADASSDRARQLQRVRNASNGLKEATKELCGREPFTNSYFSATRLKKRLDLYKALLKKALDGQLPASEEGAAEPKGRGFPDHHNLKQRLYAAQNKQCAICRSTIHDIQDAELDHKVPVATGGSSDPGNAQLVHQKCNRFKGSKSDADVQAAVSGRPLPTNTAQA